MKICPARAELFYVGRGRDMTNLTVAYGNFANASITAAHFVVLATCCYFTGT